MDWGPVTREILTEAGFCPIDRRLGINRSWRDGVRLEATVRGHRVLLDQPRDEGGTDEGMTPVEAMAVALGSCVSYFVVRFCQRHVVQTDGVSVGVTWDYTEKPHRVGAFQVAIEYRGQLDEALRERLLNVAKGRCTIHQTLAFLPEVSILLTTTDHVSGHPQGTRT